MLSRAYDIRYSPADMYRRLHVHVMCTCRCLYAYGCVQMRARVRACGPFCGHDPPPLAPLRNGARSPFRDSPRTSLRGSVASGYCSGVSVKK